MKVGYKVNSVLIAFLFLFASNVFSQFKADPSEAAKLFKNTNYRDALQIYLMLLKKEPKNVEYNHKAALCYLNANTIKAKAIPLMEFVTKQDKVDLDAWRDLGRAYHAANRFDDAIKAYNLYKDKGGKPENVERLIEQCVNGKVLVKKKLNVTFENLGKYVNSEFPDFYPFVTSDNQFMVFTSRRKSPTATQPEFDGFYPSDIFYLKKKGEDWGKPQSIGPNINTTLDEQVVFISPDGNTILFYIDHIEVFGDIHQSNLMGKIYMKSFKLDENVNSGLETSASLWVDPADDQQVLLFSSSRSGNFGETDIYMCRKLPNGNWGEPQNLGANINTKYKEEFPFLSPDGKTLYFSSQGHSSIGGFDLFKSVWDPAKQEWSAPRNLGYPINTADDNLTISFINERSAYVSAVRDDGYGDLDLYKITFEDIEGKETIFRGFVTSADTSNKIKDAIIHVENKKTGELYGSYEPSKSKGYYIMALPPGKWVVNIEAEGFMIYSEEIIVEDVIGFSPELSKNFILKK